MDMREMQGMQTAGRLRLMTSGTAAALALFGQVARAQGGVVAAGARPTQVQVATKDSAGRIERNFIIVGPKPDPVIDSLIRRLDGLPVGSDEFATTNAALQAAINNLPHPVSGSFRIALVSPRSPAVPQGTLGFTTDGVNRPLYTPTGLYLQYFEYPTVVAIEPGSPALKAGVRAGDLLLAYNGLDVRANAINMSRLLTPGREISVTLRRDGDTKDLVMTVDKAPASLIAERQADAARMMPTSAEADERRAVEQRANAVAARATTVTGVETPAGIYRVVPREGVVALAPALNGVLGAAMADLDPDLAGAVRGAKGKRGVLVTKVPSGSLADRTGLRGGDVILRVGAAEVPSVAQFRLRVAIAEQSGMDKVTFTILRDGKTHDLTYLIRDR
jgi:S1-C subfamily serine protease